MVKVNRVKKQYSKDFKLNAVKLVLEQGMTKAQVSKDLGLGNGILRKWVDDFLKNGLFSFPGKDNPSEQNQKIIELEKEVKQLKMERDILKKAAAYFASHGN